MFKALLLTKSDAGAPHCAVTELDEAQLPAGEVLVQVSHSTLNYKDGLAITGKAPVVRTWPMVPGIDFAGTVLESSDARYRVGDAVLLAVPSSSSALRVVGLGCQTAPCQPSPLYSTPRS